MLSSTPKTPFAPKNIKGSRSFPPDKCPNCKNTFGRAHTPYVAKCGHSICGSCLDKNTTYYEDIMCNICKLVFTEATNVYSPKNSHLMDLISAYNNHLTPKVKLDEHREKIYDELVERSSALRQSLPRWKDALCKGRQMQMTLNFWVQELELMENNISNIRDSKEVKEFIRKAAHITSILDSHVNYQKVMWKRTMETCQSPIQHYSVKPFMTVNEVYDLLDETTDEIYVTSFTEDGKFLFKVTGGGNLLHVHSGVTAEDTNHYSKVFDTQLESSSPLFAFLDINFSYSEDKNKDQRRRVYISVDRESDHGERILTLFTKTKGNGFKGTEIDKQRGAIVLNESLEGPSVLEVPTRNSPKKIDRCPRNDLRCPTVVVSYSGSQASLFMITISHLDVYKPFYFGRVHSGINFIKVSTEMSSGLVEDCGIAFDMSNK